MKKVDLKIHGMTCTSCEVMIERKFKAVPGIEKVNVNYMTGKATIYFNQAPQLKQLQNVVREDGYTVSLPHVRPLQAEVRHKNTKNDYFQIGAIFLIVLGAYLVLKQFDILPKGFSVSENMSYGVVFAIGLVAATSTCIAVTGGLLLALAAKYSEQNPNLNGYQKFKPHIYFNIGRVASYTVLGGAVGALGSVLTISTKTTGLLTIFVSLVMLILGFQLLNIFSWMKHFQPKMPKFLAHKIHDMSSGSQKKGTPFMLGASTFFLPCGFTQALQLYILTTGSFKIGALTMLAFSLGTLPALVSLGAISSFVKGAFQKHFLRFAGVVVVVLGFFNINNGLALTGSNINLASIFSSSNSAAVSTDVQAQIIRGKQIVSMKVSDLSYSPSRFTIVQGVPVEWHIDGTEAQGCAQVIIVPKLGITEYLPQQGEKVITFVPKEVGKIPFSCTMGMTTRGAAFNVVPNTEGIVGDPSVIQEEARQPEPEVYNGPVQKLAMEVSRERGFYPNSFTVKKDIPVELTIDAKV